MRRLLREPLLHFVLIGAGIFVLFGLFGRNEERPDRIVLTRGELDQLVSGWQRTWQRSPTEAELAGLVDGWIREQVYAREAIAMGLDQDDTIIRRRLRQKIEFLVDDLADAAPPTEDELAAFLSENPARFREPVRVSFRHVYVSVDRRGDAAWPDAERLLAELRGAGGDLPADTGDPISLEPVLRDVSVPEVARRFGGEFAEAVGALEPGDWQGPVPSGFGLHLVQVTERTEPGPPTLDAVRAELEREVQHARRQEAAERFYEALRARYDVVLEDGILPPDDAASADTAPAATR
jgi:hypothetical protein